MIPVVGVRFKKAGKVYFFAPGEFALSIGTPVIVETIRGMELGEVASSVRELPDEQVIQPLKEIIRLATPQDVAQAEANDANEKHAYSVCQDKIAVHRLDMKLVDVEYAFDNSKIIFFFTANGRVDFRALVKDLASVFKTRIELRQIGVRDEAKMLGGLGSCGRPICCGTFLGDFQPVSIKMAKEQNLSLNPTKISGLCGRLMCCLKYEQDNYEQVRKQLPRVGKDILTPDGIAMILDINAIKETVRVRIQTGDTSEVRDYHIADVRRPALPAEVKPKPAMPQPPAKVEPQPAKADAQPAKPDSQPARAASQAARVQPQPVKAETKSEAPPAEHKENDAPSPVELKEKGEAPSAVQAEANELPNALLQDSSELPNTETEASDLSNPEVEEDTQLDPTDALLLEGVEDLDLDDLEDDTI